MHFKQESLTDARVSCKSSVYEALMAQPETPSLNQT